MPPHTRLMLRAGCVLAGISLAAAGTLTLGAQASAASGSELRGRLAAEGLKGPSGRVTLESLISTAANLTSNGRASAAPSGVRAPEAAIANARNGAILWSRELNTERPIASITKVMTALVVIRSGHLNDQVIVPKAVIGYVNKYGASSAGLRPGDRLTVDELLSAMLLPSGADAAYTLAVRYGPGINAFVAKMNATARQLGMTRTYFTNFDGLPYPYDNADYSTAADLIKLGRAAMAWSEFRKVVNERSYHLFSGWGHHAYTWYNTDPLLGHYPGAVGIKTGWTPFSGHCLLFEASLGRVTLIGVNLDSPGKGTTVNGDDATRMLNWAFNQPGA